MGGLTVPPVSPNESLWIIHGKRYDLTNFKHPGGAVALGLGRGRDCTELFESYHALTDKAHAVLAKYEAEDQTNVPPTLFNWDPEHSPFFTELKTEVRAYFKNKGISHKETAWGWFRHWMFTVLCVAALWAWAQGRWWALVALPWLYWLGPSHMMHQGSHFALSYTPWINSMGAYLGCAMVSVHDWNHQHVIGHHSHTNMHSRDPDLEHFAHADEGGPGFRLSQSQTMLPKYESWRTALPLQAFFTTLGPSLVNQYSYWTKRSFFNVKYIGTSNLRVAMHIVGRLSLVAFMVLIPAFLMPWYKAIAFAAFPLGFHGYIYYVFSQVSHATEKANGHGDEVECAKREWAVHQVMHSVDYETDSLAWQTASIGLNAQTIHHIFPGISTSHFGPVTKILARVCKKHKIPYTRMPSFWSALMGHLNYVRGLNDNKAASDGVVTACEQSSSILLWTPLAFVMGPVLLHGLVTAPGDIVGMVNSQLKAQLKAKNL